MNLSELVKHFPNDAELGEAVRALHLQEEKNKCKGNCGMNYCDENGCIDRKRNLVDGENLVPCIGT